MIKSFKHRIEDKGTQYYMRTSVKGKDWHPSVMLHTAWIYHGRNVTHFGINVKERGITIQFEI